MFLCSVAAWLAGANSFQTIPLPDLVYWRKNAPSGSWLSFEELQVNHSWSLYTKYGPAYTTVSNLPVRSFPSLGLNRSKPTADEQ